ncbi:hypothetical protein 2B_00046 [Ralstonia phage Bakoly]|uniref:Holin n=2 Tax=Bakolyvirus bakoly TaxID=2846039 RepID=A0A7G5BB51_9CAUD|nr:holin [Ralstonia phage Bakoly]QMV32619.1 hypothetical protein 2B_00046 [Ralstonia phage Bakoly]QMV33524.1 hypothetical protein 30B_00017 [Ralstonia phage Jenny]
MFNSLKTHLVDDWHKAYRWLSVQIMVLAGAINAAWAYIPAEFKAAVPPERLSQMTYALLGLAVVARLIRQNAAAGLAPGESSAQDDLAK